MAIGSGTNCPTYLRASQLVMFLIFLQNNLYTRAKIVKGYNVFSEQLDEIRKVKLSQLLCQNSDDIKSIQVFAMTLPDGKL